MIKIIKEYRNDVNEKARFLYNQVGYMQAKKEFSTFILEGYLETKQLLKERQEKYSLYGVMDYYRLQYELLECYQNLIERSCDCSIRIGHFCSLISGHQMFFYLIMS